ncbi:c-type cytochrome [Candidatus Thiodiazotropha sp. CDECU1]|uniref:c-type cytochrome n=1 Tax=Candidatus Thiodiazotropha sp. CDECU1 TaxID=3065865 RepID=UPI00292F82AC|nr:cytochrome c [Candidatus Thiodiazotropha sp. CDECU1]
MMKTVITAMMLTLASTTSLAADPAIGKQLTEQNCVRCHGSEVYTRENRRVTDLPGLHKQVRFCEQNLGLTWFDDQIENTATYLNLEFYKFDIKP